ncbi:hypothetical protein SCLARK_00879 [Spiroplasma clarkii]|uniref:Lipoprotein n=1 Tax=Spiroplasma clarkii TaxID=2139 RepID=A0A1Y0L0E3_9MOLU|nr:lipoprotein [Spiroplasma clarkii]ARU91492.1 hypothetical protein SCLARK_00879 [Spiroplasma clarkii]ATX70908.1 hypothetical protein SCLAR_v1c05890 [Spiroplasma clarkii]
MKKLLEILATLGLTASSTASVLACGPKEVPDEILPDPVDPAEQERLKLQFIQEVRSVITASVSSKANSLFLSKTSAENEGLQFFTFENIGNIYEGNDEVISLTPDNINAIRADLNNLLILSKINELVKSQVAEQAKYSFLLEGIDTDKIVKTTTPIIGDEMNLNMTSYGDDGSIYQGTIDFGLEFIFMFNGKEETENFQNNSLSFGITDNEIIINGIQKIVEDLPRTMYKKYGDLFRLTDDDFEGDTQAQAKFVAQNNNARNYFLKPENKKELKTKISDEINQLVPDLTGSTVENLDITDSVSYDRLYSSSSIKTAIPKDGFVENAMFFKNDRTDDQLIEEYNEQLSSNFDYTAFKASAETRILGNLGIDLNSNETDFSDYGHIGLGEFTVKLADVEVTLNEINLLYLYNSTENYGLAISKLFKSWQASWNLKTTEDRNALYKIDATDSNMAKDVWTAISKNPAQPFKIIGDDRDKFFGDAVKNTAFNNFFVIHINSNRNPYASVNDKGFGVNYSGFPGNTWTFIKSWRIEFVLDDVRFAIDFTSNEDYRPTQWSGLGSKPTPRYLLEK